jgi:hypothetical protein
LLGRAAKTAGRTALIAGTATAVSGKVAARQAGKHAAGAATAGHVHETPALSSEAMEQLKKLSELHKAGILSDDEFATQKARILG